MVTRTTFELVATLMWGQVSGKEINASNMFTQRYFPLLLSLNSHILTMEKRLKQQHLKKVLCLEASSISDNRGNNIELICHCPLSYFLIFLASSANLRFLGVSHPSIDQANLL